MQIFLDKDKQSQYHCVYSMQKETPLFLLHSFSSLSLRFRASPSGPPRAAKPFRIPPGAPRRRKTRVRSDMQARRPQRKKPFGFRRTALSRTRAVHPAYALSNSPAAPIPPPMHMVTNPNFISRRFIS